jgi:predicted permease
MGVTRNWFRRRPSDDEMREELEAHVAMRAEHDGVNETVARRRLGNTLQTRERMRRVWIAGWCEALAQDARFTWRSWLRQPGFAVAAILVLAVGLGTSTALFAALDRVLFRPLPYADPGRLVSVGGINVPLIYETQTETIIDSFYEQEWETPPPPFQSVTTILGGAGPCQIAEERPEDLRCLRIEHNLLRVLGVGVAVGRDFAPEDDVRGAPPVALISHGLWVRRFGADPGVVDRTLNIDGVSSFLGASLLQARIIGVLPPGFEAPLGAADIFLPAQMRPVDTADKVYTSYTVLARLRPDVTAERARQMLESRWPQVMPLGPAYDRFRQEWRVRPLHDRRVGDSRRVAWLLIGAVTVFLLIACVNVTNLMLARVGERRREFAVRAAVGAGRHRLARLALAESLLLALVAGGIGLLVAFGLLRTFVTMAPPGFPGLADASIDLRVFVVAGMLVVATGAAVGIWPAVSVLRLGGLQGLRSTATSSPGAKPRVRFALVTTQIALTLALLGGSALLLRSLWNVVNVPLGFDPERIVTLTASLSQVRYPTNEQGAVFFDELLARAQAMPGAVSVAMSSAPPPPQLSSLRGSIEVEGRPAEPGVPAPPARFQSVTPRYFETFRIPVIRGRAFEEADVAGEPAVVLNESAARMLFAGERELGRRLRFALPAVSPIPGFTRRNPWHTVVGVTADVRNAEALTDEPNPEIYLATRPGRWVEMLPMSPRGTLSLRTTTEPAEAAAYLRQIVAELDSRQLVTIQTGDELFTEATAQPRFIASLLTAFAAFALLLAAAGLYSVAAYLVTLRRRDIGVRMAIGASPRDVSRQVVGEAGRWIVAGALIGCAIGWMGTRALQSQLYDVPVLDPWSWMAALLSLTLVLLVAVFRPAHLAAHIDPIAALRAD